ncbi:hypothetical protein BOW35_00035 [Solemya velum gill symbiont]|uniref:DUF6817 domain-containing protein n=1 Tax=Solemya velum gill symbiont TaxID=2340 RepID=UPI000995FE9E|nr:HD domain-containing protein [Solemya velum gill symbiont]OOZ16266.1 hypothetical protein BOW27_00965 [Solemya velum gill symbiont]OOZ19036.1 hypothetical protein BOW28_01055 [Solemya velum gill symbiont]OOZ20718.1 hypothetical protein BOW29_01830 [Solemya velum gill symbiont]OOZ23256.1 hypothetical protein BOW30_03740 [Solemya velum gill symbiont]OOZ24179.1 hypothetical protein BOW31_08465 [Solemya velum gill symbiont]
MISIAQTNLQLYRQLIACRWSDRELKAARAAYELAMELFPCRFRSSGKPFVSHLVGTASVLAVCDFPPDVVIAGLLHAVYLQGDFLDGEKGITEKRRKFIAQKLGKRVEGAIAGYSKLPWDLSVVTKLLGTSTSLGELERKILAIRIANDIDDHLDCGMVLSNKTEKIETGNGEPHPLSRLAIRNELQQLSELVDEVYADQYETELPDVLRSGKSVSFDIKSTNS